MENEKALLKAFGAKVQQYRNKLGLSQEKFAKKANVHRTYIGTVERGETNLTLLNIYKLAKALEISPKDLI